MKLSTQFQIFESLLVVASSSFVDFHEADMHEEDIRTTLIDQELKNMEEILT